MKIALMVLLVSGCSIYADADEAPTTADRIDAGVASECSPTPGNVTIYRHEGCVTACSASFERVPYAQLCPGEDSYQCERECEIGVPGSVVPGTQAWCPLGAANQAPSTGACWTP